jgi:raffinose/stachyose/melibiose transport system permease protein
MVDTLAPTTDQPQREQVLAGQGTGLFGIKRRNRSRLVIAVILSMVSLGPLLYMLSLSFQPNGGLLGATVLFPTHPTVQNYVQAWTQNSFSHYFVNSLIVSIATVVITVVLASLAAFAFARYTFAFKQTIFYIFLASLAIPNILLLIPQYLLMDRLHLLDSLPGLVLLYVASNLPFTIFLLRGFFEAIPREYEESIRMDGANSFRVLVSLIVPLSLPAIAVVSMFIFSAAWDEFPVALTMLNSSGKFTLPIGLADFIGVHTVAWGPFFAASVIATIPVIVVFLVSLRWFRSGVSLGAIR